MGLSFAGTADYAQHDGSVEFVELVLGRETLKFEAISRTSEFQTWRIKGSARRQSNGSFKSSPYRWFSDTEGWGSSAVLTITLSATRDSGQFRIQGEWDDSADGIFPFDGHVQRIQLSASDDERDSNTNNEQRYRDRKNNITALASDRRESAPFSKPGHYSEPAVNPSTDLVTIQSTLWRYANIFLRLTFGFVWSIVGFIHRVARANIGPGGLASIFRDDRRAANPNARPPIRDLWTAWQLSLDKSNKVLIFKKRAWYLFNSDYREIRFVNVRNIEIRKYIFTADIHLRVFGGHLSAYYFSRREAERFRKALFDEQTL